MGTKTGTDDDGGNAEKECEGESCGVCGGYKNDLRAAGGESCPACTCPEEAPKKFDNKLTGEALEKFNETLEKMKENCLRNALLNNLREDAGISIELDPSIASPANYSPNSNSIKIRSIEEMDARNLTAEIFHAYQEQHLGGKLGQVADDNANNNIGGSNIEFEEKAMNMMAAMLSDTEPRFQTDDTEKLYFWIDNLVNASVHPDLSSVELSDMEKQSWFDALEEFQQFHQVNIQNNLYGSPIDYNMLPEALLNVLKESDCNNSF